MKGDNKQRNESAEEDRNDAKQRKNEEKTEINEEINVECPSNLQETFEESSQKITKNSTIISIEETIEICDEGSDEDERPATVGKITFDPDENVHHDDLDMESKTDQTFYALCRSERQYLDEAARKITSKLREKLILEDNHGKKYFAWNLFGKETLLAYNAVPTNCNFLSGIASSEETNQVASLPEHSQEQVAASMVVDKISEMKSPEKDKESLSRRIEFPLYFDLSKDELQKARSYQKKRIEKWKTTPDNMQWRYCLSDSNSTKIESFPKRLHSEKTLEDLKISLASIDSSGKKPVVLTFPSVSIGHNEQNLMETLIKMDFPQVDCYDDFPPYLINLNNQIEGNQHKNYHGILQSKVTFDSIKNYIQSPQKALTPDIMDVYINYIQRFRNPYEGKTFLMPCSGKWDDLFSWFQKNEDAVLPNASQKFDFLKFFLKLLNPWFYYNHLNKDGKNRNGYKNEYGFLKDFNLKKKNMILLPLQLNSKYFLFVVNIHAKIIMELTDSSCEKNEVLQFMFFLLNVILFHERLFLNQDIPSKMFEVKDKPMVQLEEKEGKSTKESVQEKTDAKKANVSEEQVDENSRKRKRSEVKMKSSKEESETQDLVCFDSMNIEEFVEYYYSQLLKLAKQSKSKEENVENIKKKRKGKRAKKNNREEISQEKFKIVPVLEKNDSCMHTSIQICLVIKVILNAERNTRMFASPAKRMQVKQFLDLIKMELGRLVYAANREMIFHHCLSMLLLVEYKKSAQCRLQQRMKNTSNLVKYRHAYRENEVLHFYQRELEDIFLSNDSIGHLDLLNNAIQLLQHTMHAFRKEGDYSVFLHNETVDSKIYGSKPNKTDLVLIVNKTSIIHFIYSGE